MHAALLRGLGLAVAGAAGASFVWGSPGGGAAAAFDSARLLLASFDRGRFGFAQREDGFDSRRGEAFVADRRRHGFLQLVAVTCGGICG